MKKRKTRGSGKREFRFQPGQRVLYRLSRTQTEWEEGTIDRIEGGLRSSGIAPRYFVATRYGNVPFWGKELRKAPNGKGQA